MSPDMTDDQVIIQIIREQTARETMPADGDPSIFAPWGIIRYDPDYKSGKCDRPD